MGLELIDRAHETGETGTALALVILLLRHMEQKII